MPNSVNAANPSATHGRGLQRQAEVSHVTNAPRYLVLGSDGNLGGYMRTDILLCDLFINRKNGDPAVQVFKLNAGWRTVYEPVTTEEIELEMKGAS